MRTAVVGLLMAAEATLVGYPLWRGLAHAGVVALIMAFTPLIASAPEKWLNGWLFPLVPGLLFAYTFAGIGEQMRREQEESARARTEAELANAQLREHAHQVESLAVLRERNRLARDVHDTIAHRFTGILMQVEAVSRLWEKDPATAAAALGAVRQQVRESLNEVRRSVHALRPLQLEQEQGTAGIAKLVAEFGATTGVDAQFAITGQPMELPAAHELCIYRAVQEGLTNAFRHGRARRVRVRLAFDAGQIMLTVEDDGAGSEASLEGGLGIVGIRERAEVLGGRVEAASARTGGFVLRVTLPSATPRSGGVA
jgi:signal transduction histidine kinase